MVIAADQSLVWSPQPSYCTERCVNSRLQTKVTSVVSQYRPICPKAMTKRGNFSSAFVPLLLAFEGYRISSLSQAKSLKCTVSTSYLRVGAILLMLHLVDVDVNMNINTIPARSDRPE